MRKAWRAVLALISVALFDCATLEPLSAGTCGNGVVDADEDCDRFAPASLATGKCGLPGEGASACRLKCVAAADCPDGWGCGVTGVCREPSGRFGAIGEGVSAGVETMVVGDFDGDRRKDILGSGPQSSTSTAKVRVHYFGENAALAQVNALSAPISSPTVRDFNKDGVDDFAFGLDIGALGVMSGQLDRSLIPAVFPSIRVPRSDAKPVLLQRVGKRRLPGGTTVAILLAGTFKTASGTVNAITSGAGDTDSFSRALPVGVDGIIGDPVWGTFLQDASSTCGEVAVAMKSGTNGVIHLYAPCRPRVIDPTGETSEWADARPPIVIEPPAPLEGGIQVIDEKGDGRADLLFSVREGAATVVYLARSNTTGFDPPIATDLGELPIASGDFDLDGEVDFVLPSVIALSNRGTAASDGGADAGSGSGLTPFRGYTPRFSERRVRWTSARVGYFNGDSLPDIVGASSEQPDIDFFGAVSPGVFVQSTTSTAGPVSRLAIGDFDGDKLFDIGFVQKQPGSGDAFDVSVAYGRTNGPPEPARVVGRTKEVLALEPFGDPAEQGTQGLALFFREPATDGGLPDLAVALIIGNGDRQPVAPLLLSDEFSSRRETDPDIEREWVPLEVHAAEISDASRVDLVAFAVGYRISRSKQALASGPYPAAVWVAPGKGGTAFDAPRAVQELGGFSIGEKNQILFEARTTVGDIDNPKDGKSEFVVFQRAPAKDVLQLFIARPESESTPIELPGEHIRRDAPITLADVDADGNLDVVVLFGEGDGRKLVVFYNDAKGGFVVPGATVPMSDGDVPAGFAHLTIAGATTDAKRKAQRNIAIVTNKRILLAAPDAADRARFTVRDIVSEGGAPLVGPTAIASGDFDGDGVDDLAIADGGALRILRQLPVK